MRSSQGANLLRTVQGGRHPDTHSKIQYTKCKLPRKTGYVFIKMIWEEIFLIIDGMTYLSFTRYDFPKQVNCVATPIFGSITIIE